MSSPRVPSKAGSHYEIIAPLGRGGMGEVYVAFDTTLQRKVALKAVRRERRLDDTARGRLLREARILSQLDHPYICRIFDYVAGEDQDFIVLELVEGRSLRDALAVRPDAGTRMRIAEQVASALAAAHAAGIIHRDLKPENIMVLPNGDIKVLDFGLARAADGFRARAAAPAGSPVTPIFDDDAATVMPAADPSTRLTSSMAVHTVAGALMGSPVYMSPEQARGEPATAPSDMFAFGLLLQELWTGQPPFQADSDLGRLLARRARGELLPLTGVSRDVRALVERLESPAPSQRPTALDALEQLREIRQAPIRRLRYGLAIAALVAIAAAGIKYTVDVTRERTAAVEAREDAVRRRGQAEALIGFMLGDLRARLQRVGRLDVLDEVGKQAMEYFAAVPPGSISDEEIYRRSQAVHQIGEVRMAQGDLTAASVAFAESLRLVQDVAARNPTNTDWQLGLATSHFYVGNGLRQQGDLDGAMRHFVEYRDIARKLVQGEPDNPTFLLELSYGHSNVGAVLEAKGDLEGARDELTVSMNTRLPLIKIDPHNRTWQEATATGHNRLAVVLEKLGDARAALVHHSSDFAIRRAVQEQAPNDTLARRRVADTASWLSALYRDQGDDRQAEEYAAMRLATSEELVARDPANADWQRENGMAEVRMAAVQRLRGRLDAAMRRASRADALLRPLVAKDPTHTRRRRDAAEPPLELATLHLLRGETAQALAHATAAIDLVDPVLRAAPADGDAARLLAEARLVAADVWQRRGDVKQARSLRDAAVATLSSLAPGWKDRRLQIIWARALTDTGRTREAATVVERLRSSGFRSDVLDAIARRGGADK